MRFMRERAIMLATLLVVAFAAGSSTSAQTLALSVAALAIAAVVSARIAATVSRPHEVRVGRRAHAHREVLCEMTAPQHPATAGRPRTRAPSMVTLAA